MTTDGNSNERASEQAERGETPPEEAPVIRDPETTVNPALETVSSNSDDLKRAGSDPL